MKPKLLIYVISTIVIGLVGLRTFFLNLRFREKPFKWNEKDRKHGSIYGSWLVGSKLNYLDSGIQWHTDQVKTTFKWLPFTGSENSDGSFYISSTLRIITVVHLRETSSPQPEIQFNSVKPHFNQHPVRGRQLFEIKIESQFCSRKTLSIRNVISKGKLFQNSRGVCVRTVVLESEFVVSKSVLLASIIRNIGEKCGGESRYWRNDTTLFDQSLTRPIDASHRAH